MRGRIKYAFSPGTNGRAPPHPQKNPMKLNNLQVSTAKKEKKKGKDKKLIFNYYACGKPGHIIRNYKLKNKVQRPQLNMLLIEPPLKNSDKDNTFTLKDDPEESIGNLQQLKKVDSPKEEKHLEYFEEGQLVPYWIWKGR